MLKTLLLLGVCLAVLLASGQSVGISSLLHHRTTTEQPGQAVATTADSATSSGRLPADYIKSKNIPHIERDCVVNFVCKKRLKAAETPKPCVKYCIKNIECGNGKKTNGTPEQCVAFNEEVVAQEYNDCKKDEPSTTNINVMPVAMIDFPCQPGYLPDSRGRCREVW